MSQNKNPYENLFGPDKKDGSAQNKNQNQYGQYQNQQQPYGQNPPYGQYQQQPYGQSQQYGQYQNQQQPYGQYQNQQQPYGQNQQYGQYPNQQQPPQGNQQYGQYPNQQQPPQGNQQYGQYPNQQQPPQGNQQYGQYPIQQQGQYGQNNNYQGSPNNQYPNQNQPPQYGQNQNQQPGYGQNQPPYPPYPTSSNQPQYNTQQTYNQDLNKQQTYNQDLNRQPTQPPTNTISNVPTMNNQNYRPQLPPIDQSKIDADAAALRKAMKGFGTDEKAIIKIIANRTNRERLAMIDSFKKQFNRDLIKDLKSELSGHFEDATLALFQDPITYDCWSLKKAMKGLGTNEDTLIEILATRPNYYINDIKQKYLKLYGNSLEQDLSSELSGDLKKVMLTLASAFRSENMNPDRNDCNEKAEKLYKAGEKRWGTDEKVFYDILTKASAPELVLIDQIYREKHKHGLLKAIDKEFSGDMKKLLQTIVYCSINPPEYFATRVHYAVKGLGTKDTLLIRILVTRDELDMPQIKEAYKRLYNKDMVKDVENDTSGDYKRLLVELCSH